MNILITGGKSAAALKLVKAFPNDHILLADYGEMPSFSSPAYQLVSLGERNDDIIAHNLLNACLDKAIDVVLPLHIFEAEAVSKSMVLFEEFGIHVLLPQMDVLPGYLTDKKQNAADWAIYRDGALIFGSGDHDLQTTLGLSQNLNGAFYTIEAGQGQEATLFIIP